ncbi:MAG: phosphotransferase [Candidatus Aminicenantes bacterium]|nr:phosphotransferase [Candidatus Aminicenantes bacterium]NIM79483.1 phosphotransferase [Candidatus Aminicenantes bacterium]NIN18769.1 phosphotransferase [Candidatus Aminicenantes bacterium]NIN42691.1 phosphotransferase [Candidatus Aminicenantes bacterium]NIN85425.1 phosphotransferase [Candidatus Aminicenantes bacterium]
MTGTDQYFPVQSTILSSRDLLAEVASRYPLEPPRECHLYSAHLNHVYIVKSKFSTYYLRVNRHQWQTRQDIEEEIDLLHHLHHHNIPVAMPVRTREGQYLQIINAPEGERCAVLFNNAGGTPYNILDSRQSYLFGKLAGKMHCCMDKIDTRYKRYHLDLEYLMDEPIDRICRVIQHRPADIDFLKAVAREVKHRLEKIPREKPAYGICHGDLNTKNIRFDRNMKSTLFDFDCFGYGWRAYDIGVYLYSLLQMQDFNTDKIKWMEIFNEFLIGYNEQKTLSSEEFKAIKIFGLIRFIWGYGLTILFNKYRGIRLTHDDSYIDENMRLIKNFIKEVKTL